MKKTFLLSFTLTSLFLVNFVFAQTFNYVYDVNWIANILKIPQDFLYLPNLLWYLIVPFIAIWAIVLGFMRTLRIFRNSSGLEMIISFVMAFATLPSGAFSILVGWLLGFSGFVAVIAFFGMFILGVILYSWNWGGSLREVAGYDRKLRGLRSRLKQIDDDIKDSSQVVGYNAQTGAPLLKNPGKIATLNAERVAIKAQITNLESLEATAEAERERKYL